VVFSVELSERNELGEKIDYEINPETRPNEFRETQNKTSFIILDLFFYKHLLS